MLLGQISEGGKPFVISERYEGIPGRQGKQAIFKHSRKNLVAARLATAADGALICTLLLQQT